MSEYVWLLPKAGKTDVPIGASVLSQVGSRINVRDDDLNEYWVSSKEILRAMHPTSVFGVEDMTYLEELQEYSILRNLQIRYRRDLIYTYVGSILVAVNPYKPLPIYGKDKMAEYRKRRLGELPPHVFAVADHSYESMRKLSEKRCIVVSGESGGGKTESTKLFLQYFAAISPKLSGKERQILDSNPILEAFGNAKTICNDNSSRFGKYISIYFNVDGSIHSARIKHYLLEKSRIVSQSEGEDNYHIFYALLDGLDEEEKKQLRLTDVSSYRYLSGAFGKRPHPTAPNANHNLELIVSAMRVLKFTDAEIWRVFELIAAILHFGNIEFETVVISNVETVRSVAREIRTICSLLQVSKERLKDSLTKKTIATQGDNVVKFLSKQEAINSRDAFVKKIFGNLFNFIVDKINDNLAEETKTPPQHRIGILDIFGFEAFDRNSFEQLCINYANEKLQQFFIGHVFKLEQEQYASEGIIWKFVEYPDNQQILDLIETGPKSVLNIINDSTKIPRGTDRSMLDKLVELHSGNPYFLKPKFRNTPVFGIQHFAGIVLYDTKNIIEKNYDSCSMDIKQVGLESENELLRRIFAEDFEGDSSGCYHKRRLETLASKFKSSLDLLLTELKECQPFFVRCIKPNDVKKPDNFDRMLCCRQLKYSGMTEVTKVREAGYPVRYEFFQFVQQYRVLVPGMPLAHELTDCRGATQRLCQAAFRNYPKPDYQLGRTKIFLKHPEELFLEAEKDRILYSYAVVIQKLMRGWLVRRRYLKLKKAVALVEEYWRGRQQRIRSSEIIQGFYRLQAKLKSRLLIMQLQNHIRLVTRLQARCRGYLVRKSIRQKLESSKNPAIQPNDPAEFKDFAKRYFQNGQKREYSKKPLKTSLTRLVRPEEVAAAKAIWLTILRHTRNVAQTHETVAAEVSASLQIRELLQVLEEADGTSQTASTGTAEKASRLYQLWLKRRTTDIEKLHFVVSHGIARPHLRDEIYCQICKVVTRNPSKKASHRGWQFLSCCVGCFPPSDLLLPYLKTFIRKGRKRYTSFCLFRLHRLIQNGCRTRPPFTTELQAIARQKPVQLEVFLKNEATTFVKIDSATTAREMLDTVAKNIQLADSWGFSLVLAQEPRHVSLGDGPRFVMDAVSEFEQYAAEVEGGSKSVAWKLYLKKEMFAPWHDFSSDEVSANLIYHQIKEGIATGEYGTEDPDLPRVAANICFAETEGETELPVLRQVIRRYSPLQTGGTSGEDWEGKVVEAYARMFGKNEASVAAARDAVVKHAASNWTMQFSRVFRVFGSMRHTKGTQPCPEVPLLLGLNFFGVFAVDDSSQVRTIAHVSYPAIQHVTRKLLSEGDGYSLTIASYEGVELSLLFPSAADNDFHQLLNGILQTLQKYSKFVISVKDYRTADKSFLELQKGDLITLSGKFRGEDVLHNSWGEGTNDRTGNTGSFLLQDVDILPAVQRPAESILSAIRDVRCRGRRTVLCQPLDRQKHYTLQSYASKFFGSSEQGNEVARSELWKCSRALQRPLLAKLASSDALSEKALAVFRAILRYADSDHNHVEMDERLTRQIFIPGLENKELQDETYCQIMKQLTSNGDKANENKVWELLWLMTGLFACEETLSAEVRKFLQSRRTVAIGRDCLARFCQVSQADDRRRPPHVMEVDAVKKRPCHIFHRVYFPDGTHKFFKLHSLTKFKDLKETVIARLSLKSPKEFCLCVEILQRLFLGPEDYYVFDYLQNLQHWMDRKKIYKPKGQYKIHFFKCTSNVSQYKEDLKFIFPQEYQKYIQGYYKIPREDIVRLAALLYRVYSAEENTQRFPKLVEKLIPSNVLNSAKMQKWQDEIERICISDGSLHASVDDSKMEFVKYFAAFTSHTLPYFALPPETSDMRNYILYSVTHRAAAGQ